MAKCYGGRSKSAVLEVGRSSCWLRVQLLNQEICDSGELTEENWLIGSVSADESCVEESYVVVYVSVKVSVTCLHWSGHIVLDTS